MRYVKMLAVLLSVLASLLITLTAFAESPTPPVPPITATLQEEHILFSAYLFSPNGIRVLKQLSPATVLIADVHGSLIERPVPYTVVYASGVPTTTEWNMARYYYYISEGLYFGNSEYDWVVQVDDNAHIFRILYRSSDPSFDTDCTFDGRRVYCETPDGNGVCKEWDGGTIVRTTITPPVGMGPSLSWTGYAGEMCVADRKNLCCASTDEYPLQWECVPARATRSPAMNSKQVFAYDYNLGRVNIYTRHPLTFTGSFTPDFSPWRLRASDSLLLLDAAPNFVVYDLTQITPTVISVFSSTGTGGMANVFSDIAHVGEWTYHKAYGEWSTVPWPGVGAMAGEVNFWVDRNATIAYSDNGRTRVVGRPPIRSWVSYYANNLDEKSLYVSGLYETLKLWAENGEVAWRIYPYPCSQPIGEVGGCLYCRGGNTVYAWCDGQRTDIFTDNVTAANLALGYLWIGRSNEWYQYSLDNPRSPSLVAQGALTPYFRIDALYPTPSGLFVSGIWYYFVFASWDGKIKWTVPGDVSLCVLPNGSIYGQGKYVEFSSGQVYTLPVSGTVKYCDENTLITSDYARVLIWNLSPTFRYKVFFPVIFKQQTGGQ